MKITLNAITLPLLEAIVTRNTGHGIDFSPVVMALIKRIPTILSFAILTLDSSLKKMVQHQQNGKKLRRKQRQNLIMM